MTRTTILVGDVREKFRELPDESVHCAVTSPPYFGLRDYGCNGQIGLEATPDAYVAEMVNVFREVRRVLRSDGTLWLNLGDSYASTPSGAMRSSGLQGGTATQQAFRLASANKTIPPGLKAKDRLMIPARVALALQADGWWLRDEIIWHKPNPMPVSVTDRTTPAHEMIYMFSKSARYHYDMEAVKEPAICGASGRPSKPKGSFNGKTEAMADTGQNAFRAVTEMRQPRSVWTVTPKPFKAAHFATFPPDLIRPCILAGCPEGGTVLDPFFGAGTTGLVAAEHGRNCIGVELNPEYVAIARERLAKDIPHD